jgi:hypothetical protein
LWSAVYLPLSALSHPWQHSGESEEFLAPDLLFAKLPTRSISNIVTDELPFRLWRRADTAGPLTLRFAVDKRLEAPVFSSFMLSLNSSKRSY